MKNLLMISGLGGVEGLVSGKQGAFYNTLEEFHKYWGRIDIISPRTKNKRSGTQVFFGNVHVHVSPWPLLFHPAFFLRKGFQLWKQHRFDLMTVHEFPPFYNGIGAWILHWLTGMLYILEVMHIPGLPRAGSFKELLYRLWTRIFIADDARSARAVRIINQHQTKDFLLSAGVPASKIVYIPAFYIDLDVFMPKESQKRYDLVYAARLEKNKGIMALIKAVQMLKKDKPDISLLVIGDGPLRKGIDSYVAEKGLEKNIRFSGWLQGAEDVAGAYRSARVFVNPSLNEGGPRVALEAMACGLPVVTTRVGVMLDVIENGKNGLFSGWKPSQLYQAIDQMLSDHNLQQTCAQNGIKAVQQFEKRGAIKYYAEKIRALAD